MQLTETGQAQRFGTPFLVAFLVLLQMFTMFSTDMYAPALPHMATEFNEPESLVNMTVVAFFAFTIVGTLLLGPMSDKGGRRAILFVAISLFVAASAGCMAAGSVGALIIFRVFQALACGGIMSVTLAIVKDSFEGPSRVTVLMIIQAISVIGPIIAPVFGAQLLVWFSWRATFAFLTLMGLAALGCALIFKESMPSSDRVAGSLWLSLRGLAGVARNGQFMVFMLVTAAFSAMPFNLYLTAAPFIYEGNFGLTPQQYSYFFGATAGLAILGLVLYRFASRRITLALLTTILIALGGLAGAGILLVGHTSPWAFFACMMVFQMLGTMVRPYSSNILLSLQPKDTGAASSMLSCSVGLLGVAAMVPAVLIGGNYMISLGILMCLGSAISMALWFFLWRSPAPLPGLRPQAPGKF
ncbi:MAG: MFS transporter [Bifidobacteriaceae bacterium]|jgi:DHA1 family bicyclomycin/chloramphenicol resistance-like MFS transporter|nr:MFS transporter [Bifidobacteriaceae bacterium]